MFFKRLFLNELPMYRYILLACILTIPNMVQCDTNYRLNTPIKPISYSIAITPYFDTRNELEFTFDGEVDITITTEVATKQIKLHSEDLIYEAANITVVNGANNVALNATNGLQFDNNYTFALINLETELQPNVVYSLKIVYRGPIRKDLNGFYRNYYFENGVKKWLGATQMEPTHARKVFPCFDEPHLKATFILTIDRPQNYKPSLANSKLQSTVNLTNGYVREIFFPTPVMSTYLVAFMVSEFDGVFKTNGSKTLGVYARPDAMNQTDYTLDFGQRVVDALGNYFGIDYYSTNEHLKLDHVALPDFRAGAMENWGLVKYREALLLYVDGVSSPYYKYRVAQIVAHETTHMWFGNLVTCHWWSNTWLNEGFANYFQDYITALIEPEVASANILVTGSVYAAYDADNSPKSPAITNNDVNSPAEISEHFGTITYQKAGSVIRMMHHLIGDDAFKLGLHSYLKANEFNVGYPDRMYDALDIGVKNYSSLSAYPETNIAEVMSSWISQAGHPILNVVVNHADHSVVLTQKRFFINSKNSSNETYFIPITYATKKSPNFSNTKPVLIMMNKTHTFEVPDISDGSWIVFNIQETGFYRVNYDDQSWNIISSVLRTSEREKIHHLNRAKIVNDLFAFLYADEVDFGRLHDTLEFLKDETDYSVWYAAVRGLNNLWNVYQGSAVAEEIKRYSLEILESGITKLGYEEKQTDDFETLRNRMQILEFACKLGHQGCIDNAVKLFKELKDNEVEIAPSLRTVVYCNGLRHGNGEDYEFLWNKMKTTNVAAEARTISEVLGCTNDETKLRRYLVSMLEENSPIKTQDLTTPLSSVLTSYSHLNVVMEELKNNYTLWATIYPSMDTVFTTIISDLHTEEDFAEFETFLNTCDECSEETKTKAMTSLDQARANSEWAESHSADILNRLRSNSPAIAPSMLLVCGLAVLLSRFY